MGLQRILVLIVSPLAVALFLQPKDPIDESQIELVQPSPGPCNLTLNRTSYSQWKQDLILEPIFKGIKRGFFVESGATDGESSSNTIFYEKQGWTGLLVEPDATFFEQMEKKHRNAYLFKGALSTTKDITQLKFRPSYGGGSIVKHARKKDYDVLAAPLSTLMSRMNRRTVDFWSLDIEGSEGAVLEGTDFKAVEVGVLLIEMNKVGSNNDRIRKVMKREGFKDIGVTHYAKGGYKDIYDAPEGITLDAELDHIFVNPRYFESRGLEVPSEIKNSLPDSEQSTSDIKTEKQSTSDIKAVKQSTSDSEQPSSDIKQSSSDSEQSTSNSDQSTSNSEQPSSDTKQSTSDSEQSTSDIKQSTSDSDQSTSDSEQSTSNNEQPISESDLEDSEQPISESDLSER